MDAWSAVGAISAISAVVGASIMAMLRAAMTRDFVRRADIEPLARELDTIQARIHATPTHSDLGAVSTRLAAVEAAVASATTSVHGLGAGMKRVEHLVDLLYQQQLRTPRGELS